MTLRNIIKSSRIFFEFTYYLILIDNYSTGLVELVSVVSSANIDKYVALFYIFFYKNISTILYHIILSDCTNERLIFLEILQMVI